MTRKKSVQSDIVVEVVDETNPVDTEQGAIDALDPIADDAVDVVANQDVDEDVVNTDAKNFKTNHNGLFVIDDIEFKEDEVKELSADQLESKKVQHAIEIGVLIEV